MCVYANKVAVIQGKGEDKGRILYYSNKIDTYSSMNTDCFDTFE